MEEERGRVVVAELIEKATNSTAAEVDPRLLKAIKSVVRYSDPELRVAAQTLMSLMKRDHSQVRYLSLLIIDELFMRSKLFRTLVVENMDQLLALSVGFRRNSPLPAPLSVATVLRKKAIEFLEKWNTIYGLYYRQVRLGYEYLKNTLRYQFPNVQENAARIQQERREREMRTKEILLGKFVNLKENFSLLKDEIQLTVDEIEECLNILTAKDETMQLGYFDDEEMVEYRSSELRQIRMDSIKEGEKIQETSENKVVFDALREQYKLLVTKHLVSVQEWMSILIRVETEDTRFRDCALKESIDIRNNLQSLIKKCNESGCSLPDSKNEDEDDIWEEGPIESIPTKSSSSLTKQTDESVAISSPIKAKGKGLNTSISEKQKGKAKVGTENDLDPMRSKLLAEAPVMKWGAFVHNWDRDRDYMANQRGMELDNHWGRVDYDAVIPADKIAELNVQATIYKEEPSEIQPCRAPLIKGGLCRRRDLRICPFHGPVIPRDDEGNPIKQASPIREGTKISDYESDLFEQLARKAVNNVRERDIEASKKRETDKKALKRAKLAKVREHNEAVLRDAAIASTSRSADVGEDLPSRNNKKQSLASMLKKKVTTKDRLAQRLLSGSRGRERQVGLGEDANYREAFPNQW